MSELPKSLDDRIGDLADDAERGYRLEKILADAVAWFDKVRPQVGPGTLPTWYVDAKSVLRIV